MDINTLANTVSRRLRDMPAAARDTHKVTEIIEQALDMVQAPYVAQIDRLLAELYACWRVIDDQQHQLDRKGG